MKRLDVLMAKATAGNGQKYCYDLKVVKYEAIQIYRNFTISFDGYTQNTKSFPMDTHLVQFSIIFNPVLTYSDKKKEHFELKVGENKGNSLYVKENYYPKVNKLTPFPPHSDLFADERILHLDFVPASLRINKFEYGLTKTGERKLKKHALLISFALHRIILAPFINLFLPIYIISILVPFSCLFLTEDCDEFYFGPKSDGNITKYFDGEENELNCTKQRFGDNDLTATYLSALLLTLVAHRQVIASSQSATIVYTVCDIDFTICLFLILFQMFLLNFLGGRIIDLNKKSLDLIFYIQEFLLLVIWIFPRCSSFFCSGTRNMIRRPILFKEYIDLRRDMQLFRWKNIRLKRKSFFSTSIKLITSYGKEQRRKTIAATTPIEDLYRLRLYNNDKGHNTLVDIKMNPHIKEEFTENLGEGKIRTVYSLTTRFRKLLLLEVECLSEEWDNKNPKREKLGEYAKRKKEELTKVKDTLGNLTKTRARYLFLQSMFIELVCMLFGQGLPLNLYSWQHVLSSCFSFGRLRKRVRENWIHIQEDRKLLQIILKLLSEEENTEPREKKKEDVVKFFQDFSSPESNQLPRI